MGPTRTKLLKDSVIPMAVLRDNIETRMGGTHHIVALDPDW